MSEIPPSELGAVMDIELLLKRINFCSLNCLPPSITDAYSNLNGSELKNSLFLEYYRSKLYGRVPQIDVSLADFQKCEGVEKGVDVFPSQGISDEGIPGRLGAFTTSDKCFVMVKLLGGVLYYEDKSIFPPENGSIHPNPTIFHLTLLMKRSLCLARGDVEGVQEVDAFLHVMKHRSALVVVNPDKFGL